jgi:hypothetical protein
MAASTGGLANGERDPHVASDGNGHIALSQVDTARREAAGERR